MKSTYTRRRFLRTTSVSALAAIAWPAKSLLAAEPKRPFDISLAQWSLHRSLRAGKLDNLDFARYTRKEFGIEAVEYVNQFFKDKARDEKYLAEMKKRAADAASRACLS